MQSSVNYQSEMYVQQKPSTLTAEKLEELQCVRRRAKSKIKTRVSALKRNSLNDLIIERRKAFVGQPSNAHQSTTKEIKKIDSADD